MKKIGRKKKERVVIPLFSTSTTAQGDFSAGFISGYCRGKGVKPTDLKFI